MPLYEYVCAECEVKFEKLAPMSDGRSSACPTCGEEAPRVLSMFAAISRGADGEFAPVAGGGCACAGGGACGCAGGL